MSIFSGFNQLNNRLNSSFGKIRQTTQSINSFTANIGRVQSQFNSFVGGNNAISRTVGEVTDTVNNVRGLFGMGPINAGSVGSSIRMQGNSSQGVGWGAAPPSRSTARAVISDNFVDIDEQDWRVSLTVPTDFLQEGGEVLMPLKDTQRVIFPYTPTIIFSHTASYDQTAPTHTNYPLLAYQNSQVDQMTITGEFYQENEYDAKYWIACLHFFRSVTKMYYGKSKTLGNPPPVIRLNGYGQHVLNNIPVVVTNFTTDMNADVDYIPCTVNGKLNYVPTQAIFTVTVQPSYARRSHSRFSLNDYVAGKHTGGEEGFV